MRHGVKKIKFSQGKDANKMLMRKLAVNFFINGKLETTLTKAKKLKPVVEKLVEKCKLKNEANKNYLLKNFNNSLLVTRIFKEVGEALKDKTGGYVRLARLGVRRSDGSETARLEWAYPVISSSNPIKQVKTKNG